MSSNSIFILKNIQAFLIFNANLFVTQIIYVGYPFGYPYGNFGYSSPSNSCVDRRPDCRTFENICDHPDYKWYMDSCCKNTCNEECRKRDPNDLDWEARRRRFREQRGLDGGSGRSNLGGGFRETERDIERERRNNEAIRRKYLGENDLRNAPISTGRWADSPYLFPSRTVYPGPSSFSQPQTAYLTSDLSKWREDNRWDRNDPTLPRGIK